MKDILISKIVFFVALGLCFILPSCLQNTSHPQTVTISYDEKNGEIGLLSDSSKGCSYTISTGTHVLSSSYFTKEKSIDVLSLLRDNKEIAREIALIAAKNDGNLGIKVSINNNDTSFVFHIPATTPLSQTSSIIGPCATLKSSAHYKSEEEDIRKWLFRSNEYLSDSLISQMMGLYQTIAKTEKDEYRTEEEIPVMTSLRGKTYRITSQMQCDYYVLVACNSQSFIDSCVEKLVGKSFKGAAVSLSQPLSCMYYPNRCGYFCLFLIGINKDWSYEQQPLGLVAIDDVVADNSNTVFDVSSIDFKNNIRVILPANKPTLLGNYHIKIVNMDGNGIACNVSFEISFSGDIKCITIKRTKDLCYYSPYLGYDQETPGPKDFVIESSPSRFGAKFHLDDGDNFIPFVVEDYHGNKIEDNLICTASFTYRDSPQINIDNNIDIN